MKAAWLPTRLLLVLLIATSPLAAQSTFVNWETPHVHPLEIAAGGGSLLAVNTADGRLEVFSIAGGTVTHADSIPVGLAPVSVRAHGMGEAWVVNRISDDISIVDLAAGNVVATVRTADDPCDVVFAGAPERAFVSCSQANVVLVFDPANLGVPPVQVSIPGNGPRALAVSPAGDRVYAAIFASGNGTTILGGGAVSNIAFPPNVVSNPAGPYGGMNPPPNDGLDFDPPLNPANPPPPAVGLIVRENVSGAWLDDNGGDWTDLVSGGNAALSGRPVGWSLADHDVAVIDTATLAVTTIDRLMNICMAIAVNPANGQVSVVGTDATNEVRFQPVLSGKFLRVEIALADPTGSTAPSIIDINPHLDYTVATIPQAQRDLSIGDPRAIVWNAAGTSGYVCGMGSNDVIAIDAAGQRIAGSPIAVGEGPTGLALAEASGRLFVLDKFAAAISVIDTTAGSEIDRVPFFDPTPAAIRIGRKHLYDTHLNSGLGQIACASCHVDGRMDRLAWDLGDPAGDMKTFDQNCLAGVDTGCEDWHPMKGPMVTLTLQDIIGKEPHHWRGDRDGLQEFQLAFMTLQGDDQTPSDTDMQELEGFLATIHFPPNPYRNLDNSLPTDLPLPGHYTPDRFGPAGQPLPDGNAAAGLALYRTGNLDGPFECVTCHTLPTGMGTDMTFNGMGLVPIPPGPNGEHHHAVVSLDGSTNVTMKIPELRNLYQKVGFDLTQTENTSGFGYIHDGSVDSLSRFVAEPVFGVTSNQDIADLVAFLLCFSGSDLPLGSVSTPLEPPGPSSQDTRAAVGVQVTASSATSTDPDAIALYGELLTLADAGEIGVVAKGILSGERRGWAYTGGGTFQSDRAAETISSDVLWAGAGNGSEVTFTAVPIGTETRIGIDRDEDGAYDRDELDACSDPADATSLPGAGCGSLSFVRGDCNMDGSIDISDPVAHLGVLFSGAPAPGCDDACDVNDDGSLDISDPIYTLTALFGMGPLPPPPYPDCGPDPTPDALTCGSSTACP